MKWLSKKLIFDNISNHNFCYSKWECSKCKSSKTSKYNLDAQERGSTVHQKKGTVRHD